MNERRTSQFIFGWKRKTKGMEVTPLSTTVSFLDVRLFQRLRLFLRSILLWTRKTSKVWIHCALICLGLATSACATKQCEPSDYVYGFADGQEYERKQNIKYIDGFVENLRIDQKECGPVIRVLQHDIYQLNFSTPTVIPDVR